MATERAKVTFTVITFNTDYILREVLRSILPFGPVVVAEGPITYWQSRGYRYSTDKTFAILDDVKNYGCGIHKVITGQWDTKNDLANAALEAVPSDTTHIWMVDSDEAYKTDDIRRVMWLLHNYGFDSMSFKALAFYAGFDHYVTGFDEELEVHRIKRYYPGCRWVTHRPPTMLDQNGTKWRDRCHLSYHDTARLGIRMYHYNRVFPTQVRDKEDFYYARAPHRTIRNYFWRVFLPWLNGNETKKKEIEAQFNGVHNFLPSIRNPSFTKLYDGTHPHEIQKNIDKFETEIMRQALGHMREPYEDICI